MINRKSMAFNELTYQVRDPLFKNSLFIIASSIFGGGIGFLFWMFAARVYSKSEIGVATALISSMTLIILLSRMGLDFSLIRFLPEKKEENILSTCLFSTTLIAVFVSIVFALGINIWSPELIIIRSVYLIPYLIFIIANSITSISGNFFLALREAKFYFFQNAILSIRILLIFPLIFLGTIGIFWAVGISYIIAATLTLLFIKYKASNIIIAIDKKFLFEAWNFSMGNYIVSILLAIPNLILPIMILNILGPNETAQYYIVFSITSLLFIIPSAASTSLFIEGSNGVELKKTIIKSVIGISIILVPIVIVIYVFAEDILRAVGSDYIAGTSLLRIMVSSSIIVSINMIYISVKRIQKDIHNLIIIGFILFTSIIILSYLFSFRFGLIGLGYAWIISYSISVLMILVELAIDCFMRGKYERTKYDQ